MSKGRRPLPLAVAVLALLTACSAEAQKVEEAAKVASLADGAKSVGKATPDPGPDGTPGVGHGGTGGAGGREGSATTSPSVLPLLGGRSTIPYSDGFGQARPKRFSLGGDPTGILTDIAWRTWGGRTADGAGVSTPVTRFPVAANPPEKARVRAFGLGKCDGRPAYLFIQWWFPQHGDTFTTAGAIPTCARSSDP